MLRTLCRILPAAASRDLVALTVWLAAAATLQGVVLGLAGIAVAACLDPDGTPAPWLAALTVSAVAFVIVQWIAQMLAFRTGSETARALHLRLGEHVARLPLGWFTPARQAELYGHGQRRWLRRLDTETRQPAQRTGSRGQAAGRRAGAAAGLCPGVVLVPARPADRGPPLAGYGSGARSGVRAGAW